MPRLSINLTEAESLKPIPEDVYPADITECRDVEEGPKAHYIPVKVTISGGEHEGRSFIINAPIEGKGAGILVNLINRALGMDYDVDDLDDLDFDTDELIGAPLKINIKNEEYPEGSGEMRSGVKSFYSAAA